MRVYRELTTLARLSWNPYLYDPVFQRRLARVRTPALLVWGENDAVVPVPYGEAYAALLPYATFKQLPSCGHLVPLESADVFSALAIQFLSV